MLMAAVAKKEIQVPYNYGWPRKLWKTQALRSIAK